MKFKRLIAVICVVTMLSCLFAGCSKDDGKRPSGEVLKLNLGKVLNTENGKENEVSLDFASNEEMLATMKKACENEKFELYYSQDTLVVALVNKSTHEIFATNPFNAKRDENYSGSIANRLNSQVVVTYLKEQDTVDDFYSSVDCVGCGQYSVNVCENGISVSMLFGKEDASLTIPYILTKKRFEELKKLFGEDDADRFESFYTYYEKDEIEDSDVYDLYPDFPKKDFYFTGASLNEREQTVLSKLYDKIKYTSDDYKKDMLEFGVKKATAQNANVKLELQYVLTDDGVDVRIPAESVSYAEDFPVMKIALLPYFGADSPNDTGNGYLFLPDGCGAIIDINNQTESRRTTISGKVYGENLSKISSNTIKENVEQFYLPVFGIRRNNGSSLFGIIKSGDANADVVSYLGKPNGNYYAVAPVFSFRDYEKYVNANKVSTGWNQRTYYLYEENASKDDIAVSYHLLSSGKGEYSDMAKIYKVYIFGGEKKTSDSRAYLNIKTIGSALSDSSFAGFDYKAETVFTSFDNDKKLIETLKSSGMKNLSLSLIGWQKGGLDNLLSDNFNASKKLGGNSGLKALSKFCKDSSVDLTVDTDISFAKRGAGNFNKKQDAARSLDYAYAEKIEISPDTMMHEKGDSIVSANVYSRIIKLLDKGYKKFDGINLGLGDLGRVLNSNYAQEGPVNRSQSKQYVVSALKDLDYKVAVNGANAYTLKYLSLANDLPLTNSGLKGETASVPFLQLVLSGYVDFNSSAINLIADIDGELLSCVESGTVPTFLLTYENTTLLKKTKHTEYYSVDYKILEDTVKNAYDFVSEYAEATSGAYMTSHSIVKDGVAVCEYSNGVKVYVNRTDADFMFDSVTVPANGYFTAGGEK